MAGGPATATQMQVISSWFTARRTRKDIAYLIETRSAAYSLLEDDYASERGWDYGCDYEVIEKFRRPLGLAEMRADPALEDWGALRASFRRRVYGILPDTWNHLLDRLSDDRTKSERRRRDAAKRCLSVTSKIVLPLTCSPSAVTACNSNCEHDSTYVAMVGERTWFPSTRPPSATWSSNSSEDSPAATRSLSCVATARALLRSSRPADAQSASRRRPARQRGRGDDRGRRASPVHRP